MHYRVILTAIAILLAACGGQEGSTLPSAAAPEAAQTGFSPMATTEPAISMPAPEPTGEHAVVTDPETADEVQLLTEIRDLISEKQG
jgi:hypothetical protein